jgi:hypothetical protein
MFGYLTKSDCVPLSRFGAVRLVSQISGRRSNISNLLPVKEIFLVNGCLGNACIIVNVFGIDLRGSAHYLKLSK